MKLLPWIVMQTHLSKLMNNVKDLFSTDPKDLDIETIDLETGKITHNIVGNLGKMKEFVENTFTKKETLDDLSFLDSSKGPILTDRSTGDLYRLYIEDGALKTEKL